MSFTQDAQELSVLLHDLINEIKVLIKQEMRLLTVEMSQKASKAGKDVAFIAVGGAIAYAGLLVTLSAAVLALALVLPGWASALLVGLAALGGGYVLIQKGLNDLKTIKPLPDYTIESLKETKQWTNPAIN